MRFGCWVDMIVRRRDHRREIILALALALAACRDEAPRDTGASKTLEASSQEPGYAKRPLMLVFSRDFCLPCHVMAPAVEDIRRSHSRVVDVVEINVDREDNERYALHFVVRTVPARVYVAPDGSIVSREEGVATAAEMTKTLRRLGWVQ